MAAATKRGEDEIRELLQRARTHLDASEWSPAFDALLEAWRGLRASEIAELCELLSTRAAKDKKVPGKTQTERAMTWTKMFHERSALGLGVLIADLDVLWEEDAQPRFVVPRLDALITVRDDPRIASTMVRVLPHLQFGSSWTKVLRRCTRGFEIAGDPRIVSLLEAAFRKAESRDVLQASSRKQILENVRKKLKVDEVPEVPDALLPLVKALRGAIIAIPESTVIATPAQAKPTGADPAALLEQVRASPDDEALRLVLADALAATDDPLGEFIVLQCRRAGGDSTAKTIARERALLKAHMKTWLGAIASVVKLKSAVFERGFLERCDAVVHRQVDAQIHFQHPEWATVRSIMFEDEARITPAMSSLREALNLDAHALEQLGESGHPKLERLGVGPRGSWSPSGKEALAACPAEKLPSLIHFETTGNEISLWQLDWMWNAPWAKQLKSIGGAPAPELSRVAEAFRTYPQLEEIRFNRGMNIRTHVRKTPNGEGFSVRVCIDPTAIRNTLPDLFRRLAALEGLRDVVIEAEGITQDAKQAGIRNDAAVLTNANVADVTFRFAPS